jgi:hypothetical protein
MAIIQLSEWVVKKDHIPEAVLEAAKNILNDYPDSRYIVGHVTCSYEEWLFPEETLKINCT